MNILLEILQPSPILKPYVKYYKLVPANITGVFKGVPSNEIELYFNFTPYHVYSNGTYNFKYSKIFVTGLHDLDQEIYSEMYVKGLIACFVIVFQPTGFYSLFGIKPSDFTNYIIPAEFSFKHQLEDLWGQMEHIYSSVKMKTLIEKFLMPFVAKSMLKNTMVNSMLEFMGHHNGMLRLMDVCNKFHITPRKLQRMLKDETGLAPKELLNIYRINYALDLLAKNKLSSLAAVSQLCGFYDQSHFIKEIKGRTGFTPGELISSQTDFRLKIDNRLFIKS